MHGGALAQKASKQKELSDHKLVKASNKRHGGGYSACALDIYTQNIDTDREKRDSSYNTQQSVCIDERMNLARTSH